MKRAIFKLALCLMLAASFAPARTQEPQGSQSPDLLESARLNSLVLKLYGEGKYDEALPLAKRTLELREKALGPNHQGLIATLLNLGELYRSKQKLGEAKSYYERALSIGEKAFGPDDLRITRILDWLAIIVDNQGDNKRGEALLLRALNIRQKALSGEDPEIAQNLFNLAEIYSLRRDYQKAEPLYQRVISIREKAGTPDHSDLVKALGAYATLLFATNRSDEGVLLQKRIAELSSKADFIQGGVLNGRAIFLETPSYPAAARSDRASGSVEVQVTIDETGKVISAKAVNVGGTHWALVNAAENAARNSRFSPTLLSGVPVKVIGIIIYNFFAY